MDLAAHSLVISQCQHRAQEAVLRCYDAALWNQCEPACIVIVTETVILAEHHNAEHIESIWWPAGVNCLDEVSVDYCHIEAAVIITLVLELISCSPDVQAAGSPSSQRPIQRTSVPHWSECAYNRSHTTK